MSSRKREEERIERIIRSLLKLPENRRCINCNNLGPQYVCTTFWTFVCTSCSGVHREFTHRVKSVSMAKFKAEEVSALQAGGNERAREIYFKEWDPQRHSFPNSSSQSILRDFIRSVYVDRKFTGERSVGRLAMVKGGDREDSFERRSIERSSPGGRIEDRTLKYYIDERGSPHYKLNNVGSFSRRNRPVNFEIVDDRFRDDRFGSRRRSESHRPSNEESRAESGSPVSQKGRQKISPPIVHPVRDTSGENGPSLQVGTFASLCNNSILCYCVCVSPSMTYKCKLLKMSFFRYTMEKSVLKCKTASLTVPGSVDGKSLKFKRVTSGSLIEFVSDSMPPHAAATQIQQTALSTNGGNRDSVQSSTKAKVSDDTNVNSLEFLLFGLSVPAAAPVDKMSAATGNADAQSAVPVELSNNVGAIVTVSTTNVPAVLSTGDAHAASPAGIAPIVPNSRSDSMVKVTDGQQLSIVQSNQPHVLHHLHQMLKVLQVILPKTRLKLALKWPKIITLVLGCKLFRWKQSLLRGRNFQCSSSLQAFHRLLRQFLVGKLVHLMEWDIACSIILMQCQCQLFLIQQNQEIHLISMMKALKLKSRCFLQCCLGMTRTPPS
ncbi:hypothetical protein CsSME_00044075 [Camellia sinensis var. sinensis]